MNLLQVHEGLEGRGLPQIKIFLSNVMLKGSFFLQH